MILEKRKLGKQGLEVSALGLGCMGMSQSYGIPIEAESIKTLHRAVELGLNFFDTAEVYGPYTNEELLGRALKPFRNQIIIATKFGFDIQNGKMSGVNSKPEHITLAVENSLKRLQTDYIDLLYQHRIDPNVPIEDTVGAMAKLVQEGKVRYLGLSEAGVTNIKKAHATYPISALQSEYSIWERNLEDRIIPLLQELGIGLVPFSPIGRGFLAGTAKRAEEYPENDYRITDPRYQGRHFDANMQVVSVVYDIAKEKNATAAQVALAWILHKGNNFVPIPGTKNTKYLEENLGALNIKLSAPEIKQLDDALSRGILGSRYSEQHMKYIDRD